MRLSRGHLLSLVACAVITVTLQEWVGEVTIYSDSLQARRDTAHQMLWSNRVPAGRTWIHEGLNRTNIRIGAVYLAETVHRVTGLSLGRTYKLIDSVALFLGLVVLCVLLREFVPAPYMGLGLWYCGAVLPLTYFQFYFHFWDRLSFLGWNLVALFAVRGWLLPLLVAMVLTILVKYDAVMAPLLYWLLERLRREPWPVLARSALLVTAAGLTLVALLLAVPGGFEPASLMAQVRLNFSMLLALHLQYPPLLMFGLPALAILVGYRHTTAPARSCALMALLLAIPLAIVTNFHEVRAQVMLLVLLLPAALEGIRGIVEEGRRESKRVEES